jgi:hypothetical protein
MQRNIDDRLIGLLIGQAGIRRLRGKVRWEGNLDESRLGQLFEQHQKVIYPDDRQPLSTSERMRVSRSSGGIQRRRRT